MIKVESAIELKSVRIDFNGPELSVFAQGVIHPLGVNAPDKTGHAEIVVRQTYSAHGGELAENLEAVLAEMFVSEVEGMSEMAAGIAAKRQEGSTET